jgi:hypothetical protein
VLLLGLAFQPLHRLGDGLLVDRVVLFGTVVNDHAFRLAVALLILVFAEPVDPSEALPQRVEACRLGNHRVEVEVRTRLDALGPDEDQLGFVGRALPRVGGDT